LEYILFATPGVLCVGVLDGDCREFGAISIKPVQRFAADRGGAKRRAGISAAHDLRKMQR
jgi:hypothetical protein